jgi:hypothetical protein
MTDPADPPVEESVEARIARLEAQAASAPTRTVVDKLSRYLPFLALSHVFVTAPAFLISIGVAYFTFVQADATKKMQVASVWPHVEFDTGNLTEAGDPAMTFNATNQGVGPAKIEGMELSYLGKTYTDPHQLIRACCAGREPLSLTTSSLNGQVMRPGEEVSFIKAAKTSMSPAAYTKLDRERFKVRVKLCYCSVFDDCWIEDSQMLTQEQVKQCPANWTQFGFPSPRPATR